MDTTEQELLARIDNDLLRDSIVRVRKEVESIWSQFRLVKPFTDHGIKHNQRIAKYALKLLNTKKANVEQLTNEEMFLLLGGIYLHDFGMQCDLANGQWSAVKAKAVELGATFDVAFDGAIAGDYDESQQGAIRKNHQFLSAAAIIDAQVNTDNVLYDALRPVRPSTLVLDLADICRYHTGTSIKVVPTVLHNDRRGRMQLVAALLRFADELDISYDRVDTHAIDPFVMPEESAAVWYLHDHTEVAFDGNAVTISVSLSGRDYDEFHDEINKRYVERFYDKNKETIQIINQSGFEVVLSVYGRVHRGHTDDFSDIARDGLRKLYSLAKDETMSEAATAIDADKTQPATVSDTVPPASDDAVHASELPKQTVYSCASEKPGDGMWSSQGEIVDDVFGGVTRKVWAWRRPGTPGVTPAMWHVIYGPYDDSLSVPGVYTVDFSIRTDGFHRLTTYEQIVLVLDVTNDRGASSMSTRFVTANELSYDGYIDYRLTVKSRGGGTVWEYRAAVLDKRVSFSGVLLTDTVSQFEPPNGPKLVQILFEKVTITKL